MARQFGNSTGHADDEPTATVMAGGYGNSQLVRPYLQAYYGTGDGQLESEPMRTVTTKDRHGHVEATISAPPFTEAQASALGKLPNSIASPFATCRFKGCAGPT